jgi:flagellar biosynthesis/type III secretory pathway protein FliH
MILSDKPAANIDWKLNQLLSASKASRSYVARPLEQTAPGKSGFSPWTPKQLTQLSAYHDADQSGAHQEADNGLDNPQSPEQSNAAIQQSKPVVIPPNARITSDIELEQLRSAAFDAGKRQALDELGQQAMDNELRLRDLINALSDAKVDMSALQRSVTELSLFIASQIVRAELKMNTQWCVNLIEQCLEEIRRHGSDVVIVRLSRADFDSYHAQLAQAHESVHFTHDDRLRPGDVEIEMGATQISELIETKLASIARHMLSSLAADTSVQGDADSGHVLLAEEC